MELVSHENIPVELILGEYIPVDWSEFQVRME